MCILGRMDGEREIERCDIRMVGRERRDREVCVY